ncbi:hypothetical protein NQZ68_016029 [Dissostichus eleginoides]|nr:hypothetical protein NQZ68_016029 [Dissostichus eleginoides]
MPRSSSYRLLQAHLCCTSSSPPRSVPRDRTHIEARVRQGDPRAVIGRRGAADRCTGAGCCCSRISERVTLRCVPETCGSVHSSTSSHSAGARTSVSPDMLCSESQTVLSPICPLSLNIEEITGGRPKDLSSVEKSPEPEVRM